VLCNGRLCNVHDRVCLCFASTKVAIMAFILFISGGCGYVGPGGGIFSE
jgi:hypothetical protein